MNPLVRMLIAVQFLAGLPPMDARAVGPTDGALAKKPDTNSQGATWPAQPGWPVFMPELVAPEGIKPTIVDLTHNGDLDIVVLTRHELRVLSADGSLRGGVWPIEFPVDGSTLNSNLAIANMDSDPDLEILFSRNQPNPPDSNEIDIHVYDPDGTRASGWPRTLEGTATWVVVADIDADGTNEVIVGTSWDLPRIYVLRSNGTPFSNAWPRDFDHWIRSLAVADLDGDGDMEILLGDGFPDSPSTIQALHHNGDDVEGWPITTPNQVELQVVVGDVDGDGSPEVAFDVTTDTESLVYLLNAQGQPFSSAWPVSLPLAFYYWSLALGDVDGDGYLDIVTTGTTSRVFAIDRFGTVLPGWPAIVETPFPGPISYQNIIHAVADVDADGMPEVVVGALVGPIVFNHDGTPLPGANPLPVEPPHTSARLPFTATVADVDLDGDVEIFSGIWRTLYAWDFPGPECSVQWPRSSGNLGNTGAVTLPTVDTSEWVLFNTCLTGPDVGAIPAECTCLDADNDADIDLHDFAALQRVFE